MQVREHAKSQGKALAKGHTKTKTQATTDACEGRQDDDLPRDGSATNPYVMITISNNAIPAHQRHQDGRDIIPANGRLPTTTAAQQQPSEQQEQPGPEQEHGQEQAAAAPMTGASTTAGTPAGQTGVAGETSNGSSNGVVPDARRRARHERVRYLPPGGHLGRGDRDAVVELGQPAVHGHRRDHRRSIAALRCCCSA